MMGDDWEASDCYAIQVREMRRTSSACERRRRMSPLKIYVVGPDDYDRYLVVSARHEESARQLAINWAPDGFTESNRVRTLDTSEYATECVHLMRGNLRRSEERSR